MSYIIIAMLIVIGVIGMTREIKQRGIKEIGKELWYGKDSTGNN